MQGSKTYIIGDVHGCALSLQQLLTALELEKGDTVGFVGDYIDRGPDSKGVIDTIMALEKEGYKVITLRGNHEQLFIDSDKGGQDLDLWRRNGGWTTMQSFGIERFSDLEEVYRQFFMGTLFYAELEAHILVHAGLNFSEADPFMDTHSMLWLREYKVKKEKIGGKLIVHGHTPTPLSVVLAQGGAEGKVNLDAGCVYKGVKGLGHLVALELNSGTFIYQDCIDRIKA